ncbi:MAG: hypothetical protein LBK60_00975 [Verrucomicrobiales bacterium]|jgi:hypothetical protein|nr:hypothetical protein [Verrucomicrobiales bacterium]
MNLESSLASFSAKVRAQLPRLFARYQSVTAGGGACYVNQPGQPRATRPNCDAVEIAALFNTPPPGRDRAGWVGFLQSLQDPASGLAPDYTADDARLNPPPPAEFQFADQYSTMAVNYALECLGARLALPVTNAARVDEALLVTTLDGLHWRDAAWGAGHWIDCHASCLCANRRHFGLDAPFATLFAWLDRHCDPVSGLWGAPTAAERWLQPVNGFYRLTRGAYAQFGRPLPQPRAAKETIWRHAADVGFFGAGRGNACYVLDVAHPLWLCLKQDPARRDEIRDWAAARLPLALTRWQDGRGFAFDPFAAGADGEPGLQGTEMWLSIIWLLADLCGAAASLGYEPQGVHRPAPALTV